VTSYIESAAGVAEGARTGLHSVVVAVMFALAIFATPIAGIVPAAATAPALIVVGFPDDAADRAHRPARHSHCPARLPCC